VFLLALLLPAQALADSGAIVRSALIPGTGQAHKGHYRKAAIFVGATILSGASLFLTQIQYNQAADRYQDEKRIYLAYEDQLAAGQIINIEDMNATYAAMESGWNDSEDRIAWRNAFLVALSVTYVWNLIDVIVTEPHKVDPDEREVSRYSIQSDGRQVRFTANFGF
jgi:hypothetical protein